MININSRVFIAGHKGMLGSSIFRILKKKGYKKIITIDKKDLDLRNQNAVRKFFKARKPEVVIIAAAKVGGIKANIKYPANFISDNLQIQTNLISLSHTHDVKKLILFGCGEFFNDYEGIRPHPGFPETSYLGHLRLLYFVDVDAKTHNFSKLEIVLMRQKMFALTTLENPREEAEQFLATLWQQYAFGHLKLQLKGMMR